MTSWSLSFFLEINFIYRAFSDPMICKISILYTCFFIFSIIFSTFRVNLRWEFVGPLVMFHCVHKPHTIVCNIICNNISREILTDWLVPLTSWYSTSWTFYDLQTPKRIGPSCFICKVQIRPSAVRPKSAQLPTTWLQKQWHRKWMTRTRSIFGSPMQPIISARYSTL